METKIYTRRNFALHYRTIATKLTWCVGNSHTVLRVEFQEKLWKGSRDTAEKMLVAPHSAVRYWPITTTISTTRRGEALGL